MKVGVGDVIEFKPRYGRQRIVAVTRVHAEGFDAVPTGARHVKVFGYHHQIIRVLRRLQKPVVHKTKVVGLGDNWVAWVCTCKHSDLSESKDAVAAMKAARVAQGKHKALREEAA